MYCKTGTGCLYRNACHMNKHALFWIYHVIGRQCTREMSMSGILWHVSGVQGMKSCVMTAVYSAIGEIRKCPSVSRQQINRPVGCHWKNPMFFMNISFRNFYLRLFCGMANYEWRAFFNKRMIFNLSGKHAVHYRKTVMHGKTLRSGFFGYGYYFPFWIVLEFWL